MIFVVAAFIGIAGAQNATPNLPVGLHGSVSIGGNPAPQGTAIYAKVGDTVVGQTEVQTAGVYGDTANNLLPVAPPNDGTTVDIYVNNVKVKTFPYYLNDAQAGKIFNVELSTTAPISGSSGGGGGGGGGETQTPAVTATGAPKESSLPKESLPPAGTTPVTGTTVSPPVAPTKVTSSLPLILGVVVAALAVGGIIVARRKKGRL